MATKGIVARIEEIRSRGTERSVHEIQIRELSDWWKNQMDGDSISSCFIPIRLFTIIEVTLRATLCQLIDRDGTFLERARQLWGKEKLDFEILLGLQGKRITIGELISHTISLNSIDQIIAAFETLDPDFKKGMSNAKNKWDIEVNGLSDRPIISDINQTISILKGLIEKRHILTHEIPDSQTVSKVENDAFISSTLDFLNALQWSYSGDNPLTQSAMTQLAFDGCTSAKDEMERRYSELTLSKKTDVELLDISQKFFLESALANANLVAEQVVGGSMYPMIHSLQLESEYRDRIKFLQNWIQKKEGEL